MAVNWLLVLSPAAIFISMVILAVVCLRCRTKVSIRQAHSDGSSEFRVVHPSQLTLDPCNMTPSNLLSSYSPSDDPAAQRRHRSFTLTETESNPSYENPADGSDSIHGDSDADTGYIHVLPGDEPLPTNQSRASTPSSDVRHGYENVPQDDMTPSDPSSVRQSPTRLPADGEEDKVYVNVDPKHFPGAAESSSSSDTDDEDDDVGNYVNVHDGVWTDPPSTILRL
ncbi:uncharacterized protein [Antennarius striatus]|uniref:uncharacterized protein n=1 Tax=Antennarius striatus TaxID=241820 RepID=UPI0035AE59BF